MKYKEVIIWNWPWKIQDGQNSMFHCAHFFSFSGLSEKMHSIPIEAIHALPPGENIKSDESVIVSQIEQSDIHDKEVSPIHSKEAAQQNCLATISSSETCVDTEKVVKQASSDKFESGKNGYIQPLYLNSDVIEDVSYSVNTNTKDGSVPDEENEKCEALSPLGIHVTDDTFPKPSKPAFDDFRDCDSRNVENIYIEAANTLSDDNMLPGIDKKEQELAQDENFSEEKNKLSGQENKEIDYTSDHDNAVIAPGVEFQKEFASVNDDFGDFDNAFFSSSDIKYDDPFPENKIQDISDVDRVPIRNVDPVFDDSDDDFGDFGEVVTPQEQKGSPFAEDATKLAATLSHNTPQQSTDAILNLVI